MMVSLSPKHYFKRSVKCRFVMGGVVGESAGIQETIPDRNGMQLWSYGVKLAITPLALVTCGDLNIKTIKNMDYIANIHSYIHNIYATSCVTSVCFHTYP